MQRQYRLQYDCQQFLGCHRVLLANRWSQSTDVFGTPQMSITKLRLPWQQDHIYEDQH